MHKAEFQHEWCNVRFLASMKHLTEDMMHLPYKEKVEENKRANQEKKKSSTER